MDGRAVMVMLMAAAIIIYSSGVRVRGKTKQSGLSGLSGVIVTRKERGCPGGLT